jgi:hypothetical protein
MFIVPIALVAALAVLGPARPSGGDTVTAERPQASNRLPVLEQIGVAQPPRVALAQEDPLPGSDEEPARQPGGSGAPDPMATEEPAQQPSGAEAPLPATTAEPAQPAAGSPAPSGPAPIVGAATPTIDFSEVMNAPSVQTAIAQFSGMSNMLPAMPVPSGQANPVSAPAQQTQQAYANATMTAIVGR